MAQHQFTQNEVWSSGVDGQCERGYRVVAYSGSLGGGSAAISVNLGSDVGDVTVPNAKLTASKVDANGDVVRQLVLQTAGTIKITLSGATNPNCWFTVF